jgi:hypothetical protein
MTAGLIEDDEVRGAVLDLRWGASRRGWMRETVVAVVGTTCPGLKLVRESDARHHLEVGDERERLPGDGGWGRHPWAAATRARELRSHTEGLTSPLARRPARWPRPRAPVA